MAKSYAPLALCFLVLFHVSFAQIERIASREGQQREPFRQRGQRFQLNQCQLDNINAREPKRRIDSEAGVTEIWDENDEQFQCAGVVPIRHRIQAKGLLLPAYSNGPRLVYVEQGRGIQGAAIPGCPETFQSTGEAQTRFGGERGQTSRDQHQKVRRIREGDILAVPSGVADWIYNDGQNELVLVMIIDTSNPSNQLDQNFRKFFLAGSPPQELQSQLRGGQFQGRAGERHGLRERIRGSTGQTGFNGNIFSGFDENILAEAFNVNTDLARRLRSESDSRGIIVRVEQELEVLSPEYSAEEEFERGSRHGGRRSFDNENDNGLEETFCSARFKHNINEPSRADVYNPRAGRVTTINSLNLPILRFLRISAQKVVLYKNAIMAPHWNMNAHSVCYFVRGSGRVQIVSDNGQTVFDGQVQGGQFLTVPQNFAVVQRAGGEGLEWVSFKTNDHAQISQLAGRVSAIRAMPEEVLANAYQISREDARRIKNSREEVTIFSPLSSSQYGRE